MFNGSITALVTPFKDNKVDLNAIKRIVDWQISEGSNGLVPVGTTGESPTLTHDEHEMVVEQVVRNSSERVPVIAGAGSNNTAETIRFMKHAESIGANAGLVVTPYYNKPTQEGLYQHFSAVAAAVSVPVIVYDIPGRSIVKVDDATMARLAADHVNIKGIKDATADVGRPTRLRNLLGADFAQLSGEDATALPYLAAGGHGCISVTANIAPKLLSEMHAAWAASDIATAQSINERLMPLHDSMFCEASPGPVKYAAELLGICCAETRLPLCEIAPASKARVEAALRSAGLLN